MVSAFPSSRTGLMGSNQVLNACMLTLFRMFCRQLSHTVAWSLTILQNLSLKALNNKIVSICKRERISKLVKTYSLSKCVSNTSSSNHSLHRRNTKMEKRIGFGKSVRRLFSFQRGQKSGTACKPLGLGANIFFGLIHISSFSSRCFFVQNFLLLPAA